MCRIIIDIIDRNANKKSMGENEKNQHRTIIFRPEIMNYL